MKNVILSANAIKVAKNIGCVKFINCGSLQETFAELVIAKNLSIKNLNQKNYSIAKIAARDMSLIEAYNNKIDYIHTRLSVPLSLDFNNNSYVQLSLKNILSGALYDEPQSPEFFDFIRLEELAHAYLILGEKGVNKADYYIGSKTPSTLGTYFANFREFVKSKTQNPYDKLSQFHRDIFNTSKIENDTGFVPSESFNLFMNEAMIKWLK
jgi:UDP-glucose 4-epimerase